jgi:hypothetical protein
MNTKLILKIGSFLLLAGILFFAPSKLFAQKDLPITVESGVIPPEFNQNNDTIPERAICEDLGINLIDGLGNKIQSSSWLLK